MARITVQVWPSLGLYSQFLAVRDGPTSWIYFVLGFARPDDLELRHFDLKILARIANFSAPFSQVISSNSFPVGRNILNVRHTVLARRRGLSLPIRLNDGFFLHETN